MGVSSSPTGSTGGVGVTVGSANQDEIQKYLTYLKREKKNLDIYQKKIHQQGMFSICNVFLYMYI